MAKQTPDRDSLGASRRSLSRAAPAAGEAEDRSGALRSAMSESEAADLGDSLERAKKTAPTRPHPHTPASPGVLKTAGPAAAAADRARDAATGRGQA